MVTLRTGRPCTGVVMGIHKSDDTLTWISINSEPLSLPDDDGQHGVVTTFLDISERKRAEEELRASEARWKYALEGTGDGVWDYDIASGGLILSRRWKEMLGYGEDEIGASIADWANLIHPEDKPWVLARLQQQLQDRGTETYSYEHRLRCKDGNWKWVLGRGKIISRDVDGHPLHLVGTNVDMTERRRKESEHLAVRVLAAQESERARLSHDLHDEIGQSLTALRIALRRARPAEAGDGVDQALAITDHLMGAVRRLAHQLRPPELDELGLVATLRSHLDKVVRPLGLETTLRENLGEARIPAAIELCSFRVTQEALTNCVRHSRAHHVEVSLVYESGRLTLTVCDDGIGFDPTLPTITGSGTLGLIGMRERVTSMGGELRVNTSPGKGTEISAIFLIE